MGQWPTRRVFPARRLPPSLIVGACVQFEDPLASQTLPLSLLSTALVQSHTSYGKEGTGPTSRFSAASAQGGGPTGLSSDVAN